MIIDAHCHADEYELFGWMDPPELVIKLMDMAGIDISIITTYGEAPFYARALDALVEYCVKYPGRLLGFLRMDPKGGEQGIDMLKAAVAEHPDVIRGVKLHPVSNLLKPYSPFCTRLLDACAQLDIPVFSHCCDKLGAQPWEIGRAAKLCPQTTIICHMGGFFHGEESIRMARECPNVVLDTSSTPYPELILHALDAIGEDRVVFASDNPAGDPLLDVNKIRRLKLDKQTEEKVFYKNIARILKLKEAGV